jgi:LuxR family transcriptional regulator, maltose regulon positive regulatory protein
MTIDKTPPPGPEHQIPSVRSVERGERSARAVADGAAASDGLWPLAETKLLAPREGEGLIARPRVLRALDAAADAALTLVSAPPGSGKSTAVRAWCASRSSELCWVTLDARDNDPVRLWTYVATAVDRVLPGVGHAALGPLRAGSALADPIDKLLNGIRARAREFVLVLDDLQTVTDGECLASIDYALEHLPATAHVIVLTRIDPELRLPQLRARGALTELRADELAFTAAEAHELLVERNRIDLGAEEVELLRKRTEGWPAAIVLAAIWLRRVDDPRAAVCHFGGDHRFVADYLTHEVVGSLTDDVRSFLLRVSVLGGFTAALCDGVLERSDSASLLAELERTNQFVVPLERGDWYRVHSLFAEFARFQLASREPGVVAELHGRAARWLRSRGLPAEAAEHASAAGDDELVAELLVEHHLVLIRSGGARTLLELVHALPVEVVVEHPELAVGAATAATMIGRPVERRRLLHLADSTEAEHPELFTPYVQAVAGMVRAASVDTDVGLAVREGRRAVEIAEAEADPALVAALGGYARALYLAGEIDEARAAALRAVEHPDAGRRAPGHAFARSTLALVAVDRADLELARAHAREARSLVGAAGGGRTWLGANASVAHGLVLAGEGSLLEAERALTHAERFFRDEVATVHHAWLSILLARVRCHRGHLQEAETTLRLAQETIHELADGGRIPSLADEVGRELEQAQRRARHKEILEPPSRAELAVLRLLPSELSAREIAEELFLSPNTVRSHTRSLYRKLAVNSRAEAVSRAVALGLIEPAESPM